MSTSDDDPRVVAISERLVARGLWPYVTAACEEHHVLPREIFGRARHKSVAAARHALWRALHGAGLSWPQIGMLFGKRHDAVNQARTRRVRTSEARTANLIADFVTGEGRPDIGRRIRAGEWRPVADAQSAPAAPKAVARRKASSGA